MKNEGKLFSVNDFWLKLRERGINRSIPAIYTDCRTGFIKSKKDLVGGRSKTLIPESELEKYPVIG